MTVVGERREIFFRWVDFVAVLLVAVIFAACRVDSFLFELLWMLLNWVDRERVPFSGLVVFVNVFAVAAIVVVVASVAVGNNGVSKRTLQKETK